VESEMKGGERNSLNGNGRKKWREGERKRDRGNTSWKKESGLGTYTGFLYARRGCMNTDRADAPSFVYNDKLPDFLTIDAKAGTTLTGMRGGATIGARRQSDDRGGKTVQDYNVCTAGNAVMIGDKDKKPQAVLAFGG